MAVTINIPSQVTQLIRNGVTVTAPSEDAVFDALAGKFNNPTGTTSQYIRGDGSLATFPTIPSLVWGNITGTLSSQTDLQNALNNRFTQGGNSFGATAVLGTNDNFGLSIRTNGLQRALFDNNGNIGFGNIASQEARFYFREPNGFPPNDTIFRVDSHVGASIFRISTSLMTTVHTLNVTNNLIYSTNPSSAHNLIDLYEFGTGWVSIKLWANAWGIKTNANFVSEQRGLFGGAFDTLNNSAQLEVRSTTRGFLPPRMTAAQRTAIASPSVGLIVYQTDGTEGLYINTSTGWVKL